MSVLTVENLGFTYPGSRKPVLKNVNATFAPGKTYAVTGPSGSGKSTLLSLLAGLEKPTEGRITVDGEDLADLDPDRYRREKVAFVFQSYQLMPLLTACENVALPMEMRGIPVSEADARAKELLESVGLPESLRRRFPGNLSGGEQQRVGIARSLASGAQIILADEPTGNLDDENSAAIMQLLRTQAAKRDFCVIVVTHDEAAAAACDQRLRMHGGSLTAAEGTEG
jgi:putative ABC transport system ATP-binding protein